MGDKDNVKCLVIASGGIDSGLTAYILKLCKYDIEFIHFQYGQRSEKEELWAIRKLSEKLSIPLKVFDISNIYKTIDARKLSFLMDKNQAIYSGLKKYKKSTAAWVPGRNMLFATITGAYAESILLSNPNLKEVRIYAGWAQLSESGSYPDNSERFNSACENLFKFGTLFPNKIKMGNLLSRIMKYEEWLLGHFLNFPFEYTCSCDNPRAIKDEDGNIVGIELCVECGSTKNSRWAAKRANVKDPRKFYESKQHPPGEDPYEIDCKPICNSKQEKLYHTMKAIDRLELPEKDKRFLKEYITANV